MHGGMQSVAGDCGLVLRVLGFNWNMQFVVDATHQYTRKLNSGCVWNRAVSCLPTYEGGEVGLAMQYNELQKPNLKLGKARLP